jgi:hypothetical protein
MCCSCVLALQRPPLLHTRTHSLRCDVVRCVVEASVGLACTFFVWCWAHVAVGARAYGLCACACVVCALCAGVDATPDRRCPPQRSCWPTWCSLAATRVSPASGSAWRTSSGRPSRPAPCPSLRPPAGTSWRGRAAASRRRCCQRTLRARAALDLTRCTGCTRCTRQRLRGLFDAQQRRKLFGGGGGAGGGVMGYQVMGVRMCVWGDLPLQARAVGVVGGVRRVRRGPAGRPGPGGAVLRPRPHGPRVRHGAVGGGQNARRGAVRLPPALHADGGRVSVWPAVAAR